MLENAMLVRAAPTGECPFSKLLPRIWTLVGFLCVLLAACNATAQTAPDGRERHPQSCKAARPGRQNGGPGLEVGYPVSQISKCATPRQGNHPRSGLRCIWRYDATTLYVAIRSFDREPKKIRAVATTGDDAWKDDWAVLCLNTYDDALSGLFFLVTPRNVRSSGTLDGDNNPKFKLNMKWESRASVDDEGWIAEMAIPLQSLAFQGSDRVTHELQSGPLYKQERRGRQPPRDGPGPARLRTVSRDCSPRRCPVVVARLRGLPAGAG